MKRYPADYVDADTGRWGRIHQGHDLDRAKLLADLVHSVGEARPREVMTVQQVHMAYAARVKWCARYTGWGCDQEGEWHAHWHEVNPGENTALTIVGYQRIP